ncbi:MAG TPA: hypothetical protein VFA16_22400 [Mycobacterium sp.]|uniref:hypothetical protein n=1 Tax=Mycobacterium sp. TaxID=1785 RepID=UPI002D3E5570|nr:hypothetical protein [Mycobacterium sp.]HZU49978.1 hypothetical protein [Mycobacterium sp.]
MSRTLTINYAHSISQQHVVDPNTLTDTITVWYQVGYKDPVSGAVTLLGNNPGIANGTFIVYTSPASEARATTYTNIQNSIAAQEGLNLSGGDSVVIN